jgi:hypothetical protein
MWRRWPGVAAHCGQMGGLLPRGRHRRLARPFPRPAAGAGSWMGRGPDSGVDQATRRSRRACRTGRAGSWRPTSGAPRGVGVVALRGHAVARTQPQAAPVGHVQGLPGPGLLRTGSPMWWVCIWTRPAERWCSRSTRRPGTTLIRGRTEEVRGDRAPSVVVGVSRDCLRVEVDSARSPAATALEPFDHLVRQAWVARNEVQNRRDELIGAPSAYP